jgi:hypothetical protein
MTNGGCIVCGLRPESRVTTCKTGQLRINLADVGAKSPAEAQITDGREVAVEIGSDKSAIARPYRCGIGVENDRRSVKETLGVGADGEKPK